MGHGISSQCAADQALVAAATALWLLPTSGLAAASGGGNATSYASASDAPHLLYLSLRCADRPIDLQPLFSPSHYVYSAELDYAEGSFAVDAQPAKDMEIQNSEELSMTQLIAPGNDVPVQIKVNNPSTQESMDYSITIHRLDGTDVDLRGLAVPGAALEPAFEPRTMEYSVLMPAELDRLHLFLVPFDSGQTFQVVASKADFQEPEWSTTTQKPLFTPSPPPAQATGGEQVRRLGASDASPSPSGETQYSVLHRFFPVEVGGSRLITALVGAANGSPGLNATYKLKASRAPCPDNRPYYAPDLKRCAMTCNEGFFQCKASSRCEACPQHCISCVSWDNCHVCEASQWRVLHFVRNVGGYCRVLHIPWHRILLGLAAAIAAMAMCCCCLASCCCGSASRARPKHRRWHKDLRRSDEDVDEDGVQSQRLLDVDGKPGFFGEE